MRIGFVIDDIDPLRGGMSQWSWQFVVGAAACGHELHVVSQGFGDGSLPAPVVCHTIRRTRSRVAFAEAAAAIVGRLELDVVHDTGLGWEFDIFQPHGGSYAAWMSRRLDFYPAWYRALKGPIDSILPRYRDFDRHSRRQYAAGQQRGKVFVALSRMVAKDFVTRHGVRPEQIRIVYNGVDCRRYTPANRGTHRWQVRERYGIREESVVLFLAAHNFRLKGVPELLHVASRLTASGGDLHVLIAGGKRLDRWRRAAGRLGLANRVTFIGTLADLAPFYAAADAYVHPTYYDPCSLVLLEAAASGLPIVTTRRFNGATELFREGREILTVNDPTELDQLQAHVETLFDSNVRSKLGEGARHVAVQHPIEKNVAEILRLYEERGDRRAAA